MARFCGMGFEKATGTTLQYVPYRGGAPALNDLVAGQIDLDCDLAANSLAQYRAGNVKALAVMTKTRWAAAPDVPSADEAGFPGLYYSTWHGIWAPKGTPADIVARINAAAMAAMADPATRKRIADLGMDIPPPEQQTPAAFAAFHKAEVEKWYPIVKAAGRQGGVSAGRVSMKALSLFVALIACARSAGARRRKASRRGRSPSWCPMARADRPTFSRASWRSGCAAPLGQPVVVENVAGAGRHHGRQPRRARRARRLHAELRQLGHARAQRRDPEGVL